MPDSLSSFAYTTVVASPIGADRLIGIVPAGVEIGGAPPALCESEEPTAVMS